MKKAEASLNETGFIKESCNPCSVCVFFWDYFSHIFSILYCWSAVEKQTEN